MGSGLFYIYHLHFLPFVRLHASYELPYPTSPLHLTRSLAKLIKRGRFPATCEMPFSYKRIQLLSRSILAFPLRNWSKQFLRCIE